MDSNQQDMVAQFCGVTGANANAAQTALTAANWNIEQAVALYLAAQDPGSDDSPHAKRTSAFIIYHIWPQDWRALCRRSEDAA
jgi:UBX domain-containing protein 1